MAHRDESNDTPFVCLSESLLKVPPGGDYASASYVYNLRSSSTGGHSKINTTLHFAMRRMVLVLSHFQ